MKKLLLLLVLFSFINCSKDDNDNDNDNDNAVDLIVGTWRETVLPMIGSTERGYEEFTFYSDGTYRTERDSTGKWKRNKNPGNPQITYELDGTENPGYANSGDDRVIFITDEENGLGYINFFGIDSYYDPFEYREFIQDGWDEHSFIKIRQAGSEFSDYGSAKYSFSITTLTAEEKAKFGIE